MSRRHDIDALRAIAFAFLILYHMGMYYVAGWPWHLKSPYAAEWLQWPMRFLNLWRMDLIFLISGVALGFLRRGETRAGLLSQRTLRLLLPLAFGMLVVVPVQPYLQGVSNGLVEPGFFAFLARYYSGAPWPRGAFDGWQHGFTWNHLWYLAYLWAYTSILVGLLPLLESAPGRRLRAAFTGLRGPWLLLLPAIPFAAYAYFLQRRFPATHDLVHDWYLHAVYFTVFLYGYWIGTEPGFWKEVARVRRAALAGAALAFAAYVFFVTVGPREAGMVVRNLYLWSAIVAVLGYGHVYLNRPFAWLAWANESVYPWYLLHQSFIVVIAWMLAPFGFGPMLEAPLLVAGTVLGCWAATELVARPWRWTRPLFGLKAQQLARHNRRSHVLPLSIDPAPAHVRRRHDVG